MKRTVSFCKLLTTVTSSELINIARKTLQETELALKEARADQKALQEQLRLAEGRARDLESEVDSGTRDASETEKLRRRLVEQLDDQKEQHRKVRPFAS